MGLILSCEDLPGGNVSPQEEAYQLTETGSRWYFKESGEAGGREILRLYTLEKTGDALFEGEIETLDREGSSGAFAFQSRYFLLLRLGGTATPCPGYVAGIKTLEGGAYFSVGESEYEDLTSELGFSRFDARFDGDFRSLNLAFPGGDSLVLSRRESFEISEPGILEQDGTERNGTWTVRGDYYAMEGEFHFNLRRYFSYTNDQSGRVTLSWRFLLFGSRICGNGEEKYSCSVEGITEGGYPLRFYGPGQLPYDRKIEGLGFDAFDESRSGGIHKLDGMLAEGTPFSWSLTPSPYP